MTKDEILAKARKENKGSDLVSLEITRKSQGVAGASALIAGATLNLIRTILFDKDLPEFWVVFFSYAAVQGISMFVLGLRRGRKANYLPWLLYGLFMSAMTAFAVAKTIASWKAGI